MAGGFIVMGGEKKQLSPQKNLQALAVKVLPKYGIATNNIFARHAKYGSNNYKLEVMLRIPEQDFMMLKLSGELEQIKREVQLLNFGEVEVLWENPKNF